MFPSPQIPDVFWELSTNRVLTMEFMEGGKVDDRQYYDDHDISVTEVRAQSNFSLRLESIRRRDIWKQHFELERNYIFRIPAI